MRAGSAHASSSCGAANIMRAQHADSAEEDIAVLTPDGGRKSTLNEVFPYFFVSALSMLQVGLHKGTIPSLAQERKQSA